MSKKPNPFINRELSWLEFNQRVLDEARDGEIPLLERLKFLAITASNLDEFFMVRVGGLQLLAAQKNRKTDSAGMTPRAQLKAISRRAHDIVDAQYECFSQELEPQMAERGIRRVVADELTDRQLEVVSQMFESEIFSVLAPLGMSSPEDFPLLPSHTLNLCVRLQGAPEKRRRRLPVRPVQQETSKARFAIIPLGRSLSRFMTLQSEGGYNYVLLEDVVKQFAERFFSHETLLECHAFRITRNADMSVREDLAADLLSGMEEVLDWRKDSPCVRLEVTDQTSDEVRDFLKEALQITEENVYAAPGPLDLASFMPLTDVQGFEDLKYDAWPPQPSPMVDMTASMFDVLARQDVLLYHPYDSFDPVVKLVEDAADDPYVLAIKQTLYRTSRNSPIMAALQRAAETGKHVTAILELKARFDEARNISWARTLEQSGVQVIYGVKGLKTHAKVCIIVRRESDGIQRYVHFGTGNYNETTARLYGDISFMTSNEELGADAISFFNAVTGYSQPQQFRKLDAAPIGLREKLLEMIAIETEQKQQGRKAKIDAKLNSLVDPEIINALYEASQAGVQIRLNVRGICCLRPDVPDLSENISVTSIIDRFLEHARVFYFYHGGDERVFISSADWMQRNLDRRVELLVPVEDNACRSRLIEILETHFQDTVKAKRLLSDGSYERVRARGRRKTLRSQEELHSQAREAVKSAKQSQRTVFEPHRAPNNGR